MNNIRAFSTIVKLKTQKTTQSIPPRSQKRVSLLKWKWE